MLKKLVLYVYRILTKILPIQKNIILFESNMGRNYAGNPKAIYEEMVRQGLDRQYHCYFILEDTTSKLPGAAKVIKRNRLRYFFLFAMAGIWVCDSRLPKYIIKRKGTTYIQTWHGTPLKKLALDMDNVFMAGESTIESYKENFLANTKTWDYLVSQNRYSSEIFRRAFAFDKQMLEVGYPRNDVLFQMNHKSSIASLKEQLGLPKDKRVILYAPTWRDNEFYGKGMYKFNPHIDFDRLQKELSSDTVMIIKYHYLIMDQIDWSPYKGFIYSFDITFDISTLYLVSDLLITDYSSVMFDYSLLRRPMLFYCYDLEEYKDNLRGFYFDFIHEAPGPIIKTTEELLDAIHTYQEEKYHESYQRFIEKYNHADDGYASGKIIDIIQQV